MTGAEVKREYELTPVLEETAQLIFAMREVNHRILKDGYTEELESRLRFVSDRLDLLFTKGQGMAENEKENENESV
jgi:hypothetical protein